VAVSPDDLYCVTVDEEGNCVVWRKSLQVLSWTPDDAEE
jgi:hypothetical protein